MDRYPSGDLLADIVGFTVESDSVKTRKPRFDKGTIVIPDSQYEILRWIAEMGGVRNDLLNVIFGNSMDNTSRLAKRWATVGLVHYQFLEMKTQKKWVWLTKKGLQELGLTWKERKPLHAELEHLRHLTEILYSVEHSDNTVTDIKGHRHLQHLHDQLPNYEKKGRRIPDLEFRINGKLTVLEYERTDKGEPRTRAWFSVLHDRCTNSYDELEQVWVLYSDLTESRIKGLAKELRPYFHIAHVNKFLVHP